MDFHRLPRKELQALCKKNKIPANKTNVAMADALQALLKVEEMEEGEQEMMMSPQKTETMNTPKPSRAAASVRTSTRRSTRTGAKEGDVGRKEIGGIPVIEITETPAAVTGRKAPRGRQTAKKTVGKEKEREMEENKEVGCGPLDVPVTPASGVSGRTSSLRSRSKAVTPMVVETSGLRRSEVAPVPEVVKMVELPTSEVEEQVTKENGTCEDVEIGGEINEKSDVNGILKVEEEEEDEKEDSVSAEVKICGGDGVPVVDGDEVVVKELVYENATGAEECTSTTTLEENPASELIMQEEMEQEEQKSMVLALPVEESAKEITGEVVLENLAPPVEESLQEKVTREVELENPTRVGGEEEEEAPEESKEELKSENSAPVDEESPEEIVEELELDDSSPVEKEESSELISEVQLEYSAPVEESLEEVTGEVELENPTRVGEDGEEAPEEGKEELKSENSAPVEEEESPAAISGEVEFPVNDVSALMEDSATVVAVAEIPITTNDVESVVEIPMQVEQPTEAAPAVPQKIETVQLEYSAPVEEEESPAEITGEVEFPVNEVSALMEDSATVVAVAEMPITTNDVELVVEIPMQVEQPTEAAPAVPQKIETVQLEYSAPVEDEESPAVNSGEVEFPVNDVSALMEDSATVVAVAEIPITTNDVESVVEIPMQVEQPAEAAPAVPQKIETGIAILEEETSVLVKTPAKTPIRTRLVLQDWQLSSRMKSTVKREMVVMKDGDDKENTGFTTNSSNITFGGEEKSAMMKKQDSQVGKDFQDMSLRKLKREMVVVMKDGDDKENTGFTTNSSIITFGGEEKSAKMKKQDGQVGKDFQDMSLRKLKNAYKTMVSEKNTTTTKVEKRRPALAALSESCLNSPLQQKFVS